MGDSGGLIKVGMKATTAARQTGVISAIHGDLIVLKGGDMAGFAVPDRSFGRDELTIVLDEHMAECNLPDCSQDIVTVCAMPDGSVKTIKTHTF